VAELDPVQAPPSPSRAVLPRTFPNARRHRSACQPAGADQASAPGVRAPPGRRAPDAAACRTVPHGSRPTRLRRAARPANRPSSCSPTRRNTARVPALHATFTTACNRRAGSDVHPAASARNGTLNFRRR
jgi:hypothetical protein